MAPALRLMLLGSIYTRSDKTSKLLSKVNFLDTWIAQGTTIIIIISDQLIFAAVFVKSGFPQLISSETTESSCKFYAICNQITFYKVLFNILHIK